MKYLPWKSQTNILSEAKALQRRGIRSCYRRLLTAKVHWTFAYRSRP